MWEMPISIIMILRMDNSSISYSFATKYFLCAVVKKTYFFERDTISPSPIESRYLRYSYLMIFHKMVTKGITCITLSSLQFDSIH
ncbi:hypothetical protein CRYUN_Cryun06bG0047400 [Craigia yunnanensis]